MVARKLRIQIDKLTNIIRHLYSWRTIYYCRILAILKAAILTYLFPLYRGFSIIVTIVSVNMLPARNIALYYNTTRYTLSIFAAKVPYSQKNTPLFIRNNRSLTKSFRSYLYLKTSKVINLALLHYLPRVFSVYYATFALYNPLLTTSSLLFGKYSSLSFMQLTLKALSVAGKG